MDKKTMEMLLCFLLVAFFLSSAFWGHRVTDWLQRYGNQEKQKPRQKNSASEGTE